MSAEGSHRQPTSAIHCNHKSKYSCVTQGALAQMSKELAVIRWAVIWGNWVTGAVLHRPQVLGCKAQNRRHEHKAFRCVVLETEQMFHRRNRPGGEYSSQSGSKAGSMSEDPSVKGQVDNQCGEDMREWIDREYVGKICNHEQCDEVTAPGTDLY